MRFIRLLQFLKLTKQVGTSRDCSKHKIVFTPGLVALYLFLKFLSLEDSGSRRDEVETTAVISSMKRTLTFNRSDILLFIASIVELKRLKYVDGQTELLDCYCRHFRDDIKALKLEQSSSYQLVVDVAAMTTTRSCADVTTVAAGNIELREEQLCQEKLCEGQLSPERFRQDQLSDKLLTEESISPRWSFQEGLSREHLYEEQLYGEGLTQEQLSGEGLTQEQLCGEGLTQEQLCQKQLSKEEVCKGRLCRKMLNLEQPSGAEVYQDQLTGEWLRREPLFQKQIL